MASLSVTSTADEVSQAGDTISGKNPQAILVAMPEITKAHIDLAKYEIGVVVVDGHTEVQLYSRKIGPADPTVFGSATGELTTVILTSDNKNVAKAIYCCR